jgi:hypothetical protein
MRNKAIEGARTKGRLARRAGLPITKNPYLDVRTTRGAVTFSRAFLRAWNNGWKVEDTKGAGSATAI